MNAGAITAVLNLDASNFSSGIQSAQQQLNTFSDSSQSAGTRIQALGGTLTSYGSMLTKNVSLPLIGIGAAAVKVASDFEAGMSEVQALTGATGTEFEALSNQAKELGKTTMFSATQSANAMSELASAGFTTTEIMDAMPGLLDLAASGNIDLAEAANIASSTLRGFGLEASQSSHVSDV